MLQQMGLLKPHKPCRASRSLSLPSLANRIYRLAFRCSTSNVMVYFAWFDKVYSRVTIL
jgi:hypothetical protein